MLRAALTCLRHAVFARRPFSGARAAQNDGFRRSR